MKRLSQLAIVALLLFGSLNIPQGFSQESLSLPAADLIGQAQYHTLLSNGAISNQHHWSAVNEISMESDEVFVDHQRSASATLLITHLQNDPNLRLRFNNSLLQFDHLELAEVTLVRSTLYLVGVEQLGEQNGLYRFRPGVDETPQRLRSEYDGPISQLRATANGGDTRLAWVERTASALVLKGCTVVADNCRSRIIADQALSNPFQDILLSQNDLVIIREVNQGVNLEYCHLLRADVFSQGADYEVCEGKKILSITKGPADIKQFSFEKPFLSWSQREEGIFEIAFTDFSEPKPKYTLISTQSQGDQIHAQIARVDTTTPIITWESYSSGERDIILGRRDNDQWRVWSSKEAFRYPKILVTSQTIENCQEAIQLSGWNLDNNTLVISERRGAETIISTKLYRFEEAHEMINIGLDGELSPSIELRWRTKPTDSWKSAQHNASAGAGAFIVNRAIKTIQLQIRLPQSGKHCFRYLDIHQEGAIVEGDIEREGEVIPIETDFDPQIKSLDQVRTEYPRVTLNQEQVSKLTALEQEKSNVQIVNIVPRSTLPQLDLLSGTAPDSNKPIWFHLINDQSQSITLGQTRVNNGSFLFRPRPIPADMTGEISILATQIPDIRLASLYPEKTQVVPVYLYREEDLLKQKKVIDLAIDVDQLEFSSHGQQQTTLKADFREVYREQDHEDLTVSLSGTIYGENLTGIQLRTVLLPDQILHDYELQDPSDQSFMIDESYEALRNDQQYQLILYAIDPEKTQSTSHSVSFVLKDASEKPTIWGLFLGLFRTKPGLSILAAGLILMSIIILFGRSGQRDRQKVFYLLLIIAWAALFFALLRAMTQEAFQDGLLSLPEQEIVQQLPSWTDRSQLTLTTLDENLDIQPALASRWTTIDPNTWEFKLRFIASDDIIHSIRRKIEDRSSQQQYIASVTQVVRVNDDTIQFVTQFPDPLLPLKLSQFTFENISQQKQLVEKGEEYLPLEEASYHQRLKRNPEYYATPFLPWKSPYRSERVIRNEEALAHTIDRGEIDLYLNPPSSLWNKLKSAGYQIMPRTSTQSKILLTNRNSFILANPSIIRGIRQILKQPSLLEAFDENYARIATQIVPPGVFGYTANLDSDPREKSSIEWLKKGMTELGIDEVTLKLHFPSQEHELARVIESLLQEADINVIPSEIQSADFETALLEGLSDLILMPLNFELGDAGPFLDTLVDSQSPFNNNYQNEEVDELITSARHELSTYRRLQQLQQIMQIIVYDDPIGIPLIYPQRFEAVKQQPVKDLWVSFLQWLVWGAR